MTSTLALEVFLQYWPACVDCRDLGRYRCPDIWLHEAVGICSGCEAIQDIRGEHASECSARDQRILAQANATLRNVLRAIVVPYPAQRVEMDSDPEVEDRELGYRSDDDTDSFDEEQITRDHFRICEFCSPFWKTACKGTRTCHEMAGYNHALSCQRMTYICKDMPQSNPRDCPLQERIVALVVRLAGDENAFKMQH